MELPPFIILFWDRIELIFRKIDDIVPIPYAHHVLLFIIGVGILTFLMNLWSRLKPKQNLQSAKLKGAGARKLKHEAKSAERSGNFAQAAESYKALGKSNKALDLFKKGKAFRQAGELLIQMGRKEEAIQLWISEGQHILAAKQLAADGAHDRAASCYERAGNSSQAGEMYEKAGNYEKAGEQYSNAGFHAKAAKCFEKTNSTFPAAKAYEKYFIEQAPSLRDNITADKERAIRNLAFKSGTLYLKIGKIQEAADIFLKGGLKADAARTFEKLGEFNRAAKLFQEAGLHNDAARLLESGGGDKRETAAAKAEAFRSQGKYAEAAQLFAEAQDYNTAADLYAQADMNPESAEMLMKAGSFCDAGAMYIRAGDNSKAAWAFENARDYDNAIKLYKELGDAAGMIRVMEAAGRFLDASKALMQQKRSMDAYKLMEKIPLDHDDFRPAAVLMAKMQLAQNSVDAAIHLIQRGINGEALNQDTIDLYYNLAMLFEQRADYQLAMETYTKVIADNFGYKDAAARQQNLKNRMMNTIPGPVGGPQSPQSAEATAIFAEGGGAAKGALSNPRFKIMGELGRGGMGVVYKAQDMVLDRPVAYKVLPPDMKNHPEVVEMFNKEAKAIAKLNHSNIVTVYDVGGIGGEYYIVMEYIEGRNLKDAFKELVAKQKLLPMKHVISIFKQLAEALKFAHSNKVVHRDIKTSNVMLKADGSVKLMDFGLAKVMAEAASDRTAVSGTPYYMSPEQVLGKGVDHRTDIYSLGIMMYELAAGHVPFQTGDLGYHHLHTEPEPPRNIRPDIPEEIERIILKSIQKDKESRYQSPAEILEDLNKI